MDGNCAMYAATGMHWETSNVILIVIELAAVTAYWALQGVLLEHIKYNPAQPTDETLGRVTNGVFDPRMSQVRCIAKVVIQ